MRLIPLFLLLCLPVSLRAAEPKVHRDVRRSHVIPGESCGVGG
jgi:hypothetical protein